MLNKPLLMEDLEDLDPELTKNLLWTLQNSLDGDLGISFSQNIEFMGEVHKIELCENGEDETVTELNK